MISLNLKTAYRTMTTMRLFEEAVGRAVETGEVHGEMHLGIGQEAVAAALAVLLRPGDAVVSTHRPHLHGLAHSVDPVAMLAELLEREGLCGGKGGHMHLFSAEQRFMCTGIVGAGSPLAAGYALAQKREGAGNVSVAITGDGAMNQGAVLETMNLAALWRLPIVFLCEDNGYGISVKRDAATAGVLSERGDSFGIPGYECEGIDPDVVFDALERAFTRARTGAGPALVVASVYRFRGHYEGDADTYRPQGEKDEAMSSERDPVPRLRARLLREGTDEKTLRAIDAEAAHTIEGWLAEARALPLPDVGRVREDVFA